LTVVVQRSLASQARPAVDSAWTVIDSTFGNSAAFLAQRTFALKDSVVPMVVLPGEIATSPWSLLGIAVHLIDQRADSGLTSWLFGEFSPTPLDHVRWDLLYVELAATPWSRIQECYADHLRSCRLALGLDGREDPITQWYDAEDRRRFVAAASGDPKFEGQRRLCLAQGIEATCTQAFRAINRGPLPPPLDAYARVSLLQMAITLGGRNAYDRLMAGRGQPIAIRLGLAARLPTDSLVEGWRRRIMSSRPTAVPLTARGAWMSVTWCLILGLLALRSSRWR